MTHGPDHPVSYSITRDGRPQHDGYIDVHGVSAAAADFTLDGAREVVDSMIVHAVRHPYADHPAATP